MLLSPELSSTEKKVLGNVYGSTKAYNNLRILCDDFGGRFAGTEENDAAAEFILSLFENYGFENPHLESFNFLGCEVGVSSLEIKPGKKIPALTLPMTKRGNLEEEIVYVGDGSELDLSRVDGKIILSLNRLPLRSCVNAGAVGFVWMHPFSMMGPPTGVVPSLVPSISVSHEQGLMIRRMIKRYGKVLASIETDCEIFMRKSYNVCGEIYGSGSSDEFVLLGGHFDGHEVAQAAFDCGSACMAVTEMGRVLQFVCDDIQGNVKVVCFSAEEFGFHGSIDYAKKHSSEMKNMKFSYQLDCNAGDSAQMLTVDYWPQLESFFNRIKEALGLPMPFDQRMGPGDSRAFHELGIPTGSILDYRERGRLPLLKTVRHTIYDTFDKINSRHLQDDVALGSISTLRILDKDVWPSHRSKKEIEEIKTHVQ